MFVKSLVSAVFAAAILFAGLFSVSPVQAQSGQAHLVEVVSVAPSYEDSNRRGYGGVATGAGVGGALGGLAARNGSSRDRNTAIALGAALGGAIGNNRDRKQQRVRGFDVVVRYESGRLGSLFLNEAPPVAIGEFAYLVGNYSRTRLIPAPNEQGFDQSEETAYRY